MSVRRSSTTPNPTWNACTCTAATCSPGCRDDGGGVDIGEVDLSHLRVEKTGEYDVSLSLEGPTVMTGFGDGTGGAKEPEKSLLSQLIEQFNEKYGLNITEADRLEKPSNEALADQKVRQAAVVNDVENFGNAFLPVFEEKMMDHIDSTASIGRRYFGNDPEFRSSPDRSMRSAAWRLIRQQENVTDDGLV